MTDQTIDEAMVALAAELTREAMAPWEDLLDEDEKRMMRLLMESELLADPEGRRQLRLALADPEVDASGDVVRTGEPDAPGEASGR